MPAVVVPWRGGDPQREQNLEWTLARFDRLGWPVVLGASPEGPFNRAAAILDGLARTDADVVVVSDGDCWTDGIGEAVEQGAPWAVPHDKLHRLSESATAEVLAGVEPHERMEHLERAYKAFECSTVFVATREALETAPPDPRFVGWGHEEQALALALRTLVGKPWRPCGKEAPPCWHLYHPPQPRKSRAVGNDDNKALWLRYKAAQGKPDVMRALVAEAHVPSAAGADVG